MKTTLIGIGNTGEKVLKKCSDLPDTVCIPCSENNAEFLRSKLGKQKGLVISVSEVLFNESPFTKGGRSGIATSYSYTDIGLRKAPSFDGSMNVEIMILPYRQISLMSTLHDLFADRNIVLVPNISPDVSNESDYLSCCINKAADIIRYLKQIADNTDNSLERIYNIFCTDKNTYKVIGSKNGSLYELKQGIDLFIHRYLRIAPKKVLCYIRTPVEITDTESIKSSFTYRATDDIELDIVMDKDLKTIECTFIVAFNWSPDDAGIFMAIHSM